MDERQRAYLEAMDIPVWESRFEVTSAESVKPEIPTTQVDNGNSLSIRESDELTPEVSETVDQHQEAPKDPSKDSTSTKIDSHELAEIQSELLGIEESLEEAIPASETVSHLHLGWDELQDRVKHCSQCLELVNNRIQPVFGVGNKEADLMIIGEAPGADEDRQGEPFVGKAGQLLNLMIQAIGYKREQVYIANVLKCRPPNNRDPHSQEIIDCSGFLHRQIELVKPTAILIVGRIAAQSLLKSTQTIGRLRGEVVEVEGIPTVVTYHPAYLLRSPQEKSKSWYDLKLVLSLLKNE